MLGRAGEKARKKKSNAKKIVKKIAAKKPILNIKKATVKMIATGIVTKIVVVPFPLLLPPF